MDKKEIEKILKEIIAEKTGYPLEILENSAELESDLGIDSLKQFVIFTGLYERLHIEAKKFNTQETTEMIVGINTIQDVINYAFEQYQKQQG